MSPKGANRVLTASKTPSSWLIASQLLLVAATVATVAACSDENTNFKEEANSRPITSDEASVRARSGQLRPESEAAAQAEAEARAAAAAGQSADAIPANAQDRAAAGQAGGTSGTSAGNGTGDQDNSSNSQDGSENLAWGDGSATTGGDGSSSADDANADDSGDGNGSTGSDSGAGGAGGDNTAGDAGTNDNTAGSGTGGSGSEGGAGGGSVSGSGSEGGFGINTQIVEVTQGGPGKVDILWIIDTSGSMSEEQQYLGQNFAALINQLATAGHDFQTAITTTDVCQDSIPSNLAERACPVSYGGSGSTHLRGSFVGDVGRKVLRQGDTDLVQKFTQYANQGINGSGFEHGLKAAEMAIDKVISGDNENLVRADAFLAVIVVSDEEDDGIGLGMTDAYSGINFVSQGLTTFSYTADNFISYLQQTKGNGNFSVSAITPTRLSNGTLCSAAHTNPQEEGTQYINVAAKTGGILQSICETNWNQSLANIGLDLSAQLTQVNLPTPPDTATIKVYVDNVQTSEWTYNTGNNAVKFNAGHVPAEGSVIKVTYIEKI